MIPLVSINFFDNCVFYIKTEYPLFPAID